MSSSTSAVARIFPEKVRILPSAVAQRHLTMPVLKGDEAPTPTPLDQASSEWEMGIRADAQVLRDLVEEVRERFGQEDRTHADAWLAPRLHEPTLPVPPPETARHIASATSSG